MAILVDSYFNNFFLASPNYISFLFVDVPECEMPNGLENSTKEEEKDDSHRNVSPPVSLLPSGTDSSTTLHVAVETLMGMPVCLSPDVHSPLIRRFPSLTSPQNHRAVMVKIRLPGSISYRMKIQEVCGGWYPNVRIFIKHLQTVQRHGV